MPTSGRYCSARLSSTTPSTMPLITAPANSGR